MPNLVQSALQSWSLPWGFSLACILTTILYLRGWLRIRQSRPELFPAWRLWCFVSGVLILWLAVASPLAELDDFLLFAHMTQHLVLMSLAPPLILLGAPVVPLLRGIPQRVMRKGLAPLFSSGFLPWLGHALTNPIFAWLAMNLAYLGWHVPAAFELALRSPAWHEVEHGCFFFTSLLFWFAVIQPWPSEARWSRWAMLPYLLSADIVNTALAAFLTFCGRVLYPSYALAPRISSLTPLNDQVAAGALMWVLGSFAFLIPTAMITVRLLSPELKQSAAATSEIPSFASH
jgi:putative membrane protein